MNAAGWLEGDVALVTGGGSGIGRAVALRFLREGARGVAIVGRDSKRLQATVEAAGSDGDRILPLEADVRSSSDLQRATDATLSRFGSLDIVVPNAGIWDYHRSVTRLTPVELGGLFDDVFEINVKGYLLTVAATWQALVESRGNIVMTLSNASYYPAGGGAVYTASKHACRGLVLELAHELAPKVRVNGVAVGGLRTDLRGPESLGLAARSLEESFAKNDGAEPNPYLPLHDASVDPADSTGSYVLLASRRNAGNITGTIVKADGGIAARGFAHAAGGDAL